MTKGLTSGSPRCAQRVAGLPLALPSDRDLLREEARGHPPSRVGKPGREGGERPAGAQSREERGRAQVLTSGGSGQWPGAWAAGASRWPAGLLLEFGPSPEGSGGDLTTSRLPQRPRPRRSANGTVPMIIGLNQTV